MSKGNPTTLTESLLFSILVFCFWIPIMFFIGVGGDLKQKLTEGLITRGGGFITCSGADYDPRYGQLCDGKTEYVDLPREYISLEEAIGQHFISSGKMLLLCLPLGLIFGFFYYKDKNK